LKPGGQADRASARRTTIIVAQAFEGAKALAVFVRFRSSSSGQSAPTAWLLWSLSRGRLTTRGRYAINLEPEFASVLKAASREISTLSPNVRSAWDGRPVAVLTRTAPARATDAHVAIIGDCRVVEGWVFWGVGRMVLSGVCMWVDLDLWGGACVSVCCVRCLFI
jgi:hypothetical protein